jgi:hypothetical protein
VVAKPGLGTRSSIQRRNWRTASAYRRPGERLGSWTARDDHALALLCPMDRPAGPTVWSSRCEKPISTTPSVDSRTGARRVTPCFRAISRMAQMSMPKNGACLKMGQNSGRNGGGAFLCCSERDDSALLLLLPLRPTCFLGCSNSRKPSRRHPTFSADRDRCFRASRSGSPRALKLEAKYDAFALSCLQAMVRGGLIRGRPRRDRVLVWALHLRNSHHVLPAPRHW